MKVKIEMSPYDIASIYAFCREYFNDSNKDVPQFKAMHDSVSNLESEMIRVFNDEVMDHVMAQNEVNFVLGKQPLNRGGKPYKP